MNVYAGPGRIVDGRFADHASVGEGLDEPRPGRSG